MLVQMLPVVMETWQLALIDNLFIKLAFYQHVKEPETCHG